jgi:hypothetical protein
MHSLVRPSLSCSLSNPQLNFGCRRRTAAATIEREHRKIVQPDVWSLNLAISSGRAAAVRLLGRTLVGRYVSGEGAPRISEGTRRRRSAGPGFGTGTGSQRYGRSVRPHARHVKARSNCAARTRPAWPQSQRTMKSSMARHHATGFHGGEDMRADRTIGISNNMGVPPALPGWQ